MRKRIVIGSCVAAFLGTLALMDRDVRMSGGGSANNSQQGAASAEPSIHSNTQGNGPLPSQGVGATATNDTEDFRDWLASYGASGTTDARQLRRGKELAFKRRDAMVVMFQKDPAQAFAESLSWSEWAALPEELKAIVEKPFSATVNYAVLPNCPPATGKGIHPHQVQIEDEWHEAYVFGRKAKMTSKDGLPVRGVMLDGKVLLSDEAVEHLSAADAQVVATLYKARPGGDANAAPVLVGGEILNLGAQSAEGLSDLIANAEKSFNPKAVVMALTRAGAGAGTIAYSVDPEEDGIMRATSTWTETPKNTLAVRIAFADVPTPSFSLTEMTNLMANSSNAVKVMSYGKTWLVPRVATVTLPNTRASYEAAGPGSIVTATRTALSAIGINRDNFHIVVHAHPQMNFGYAGLGEIGGANNWLNGKVSLEVTVHELGHNYGLGHAHFWAGLTGMGSLGRSQADDSLIEHDEYGDPFDVMGGSSLPAGHFNAHGKAALNWIEPKEVITVVTNGIYRVYRYDHKDARTNTGTKLALKIPAASGEEYWISHRRLFTSAANVTLLRGANIARADGPGDQSLIDATPLSRVSSAFSNDRQDSGLAVGKTFSDPLGTVRVTTIASGGIAPQEFIDVQVVLLNDGAFSFYTTSTLETNGLVGSYVNRNLRARPTQDDWRSAGDITIGGRRDDANLNFTSDGWGARAPLRLTGGTDANWENFSVQWDGYVVVRRPVVLATTSDDSSRFWIDLSGNGAFGSVAPEYVNNHWGTGQGPTRGDVSTIVPPGTYRIRIQYEEGNGGNYFTIGGADAPFELFTDAEATTPGLTGSYVGQSLRTSTAQADWRVTQSIVGTRNDAYPGFTVNGWGSLGEAGLAAGVNGSDSDWDNFSVQWDGYLRVSVPVRMATISDDHSRMWIDVNTNGSFATTAPELVNNAWGGGGQGTTLGQLSAVIQPGMYPIRIQYEEGGGGNYFVLAGVPYYAPDPTALFNGLVLTGTENRLTQRTIAEDFTIQFWMKSSQVAGGESHWREGIGLVDSSTGTPVNGFGVTLGNGRVLFGAGNDTGDTLRSGFLADDLWHHVSARREQSSGEIALFVDGWEVAHGVGSTNLLDALTDVTVGSLSGGSNYFVGTLDVVRMWNSARTDEQIAADYHQARTAHGYADVPPMVHLTPLGNSVQVYWDPLSGFRKLEGATVIDGSYLPLGTDQNSTNILMGPNAIRFFRVRQ
jgi:hypothetical protein